MKPPRPAASQAPARLAGLLLAGLLASSTWAATGTWTSTGSGNWSDTSRWSGGTVANGAGFTANFGTTSNPTSDVVVTLDTVRVIGSLAFGDSDTGSAAGWEITGGNTLTLSATTPAITVNALGTGKLAEISAPLAGSGGFTKQGGGTLLLSGNNSSLSGQITMSSSGGVLAVNHGGALGSASLRMNQASNASQLELSGGITLANSIRISGSGPGGLGSLKNSGGDNILDNFGFDPLGGGGGGGRINVVPGSSLTIRNSITADPGSNGVRVINTGTLVLDADNSAGLPNRNVRFGDNSNPGPTVQVGHDKALGTGMIYFEANSNSTLQSKNASARNLPNSITFTSSSATLGAAATGDLGVAGAVTLAAASVQLTVHNTVTFSGAVGESAAGKALTKAGPGTLVLDGANTYTGGTTVDSGTLLVNNTTGSGLGSGAVTVDGGTLGGTGGFSGTATVNTTGVLSPGTSIGTLRTGALTLNSGSTFLFQLNTTSTSGDLLNVNGDLDLDGLVSLALQDLGAGLPLAPGTKFTLLSYAGSWNEVGFDGHANQGAFTRFNNNWFINYKDTPAGSVNGGAYSNAVTLTVIPEPGTSLLGGAGLLALWRRRRPF